MAAQVTRHRRTRKQRRLLDIDPQEFATAMVERAHAHAERLAVSLAIPGPEAAPPSSPLFEAAIVAARFAVEGKGAVRAVRVAVATLETLLLSAAGEGATPADDSDLALVLAGIEARMALRDKRAFISSQQLALLAGVNQKHITKLVRAGALVPDRVGQGPERGKVRSGHLFAACTVVGWLRNRSNPTADARPTHE